MLTLGLDCSTTACGYGALLDGEYLFSGVFKPRGILHSGIPKEMDWLYRIKDIHYWLYDLILELTDQYGDVDVAYEVASGSHGNMHTNRLLGAVHWACWLATVWDKVSWHEINVQTVKQQAANKTEQGMMGARAISGKEDIGEDEADAMGVALACWGKRYDSTGV